MRTLCNLLAVLGVLLIASPAFAESPQHLPLGTTKRIPLAIGMEEVFAFTGKENRAVRFEIGRQGDIRYNFRIYDVDRETVLRKRSIEDDRTDEFIFTPVSDGTYYVSFFGFFDYGYATVNARTLLDGGEADIVRRLNAGPAVSGKLAQGIVRRYKFRGSPDEPLLFTIAKSGDLRYNFRILNGDESQEYVLRSVLDRSREIVFTPPEEGEYVIRLTGFFDYGKFSLRMQRIFGDIL